jgi:hypothetical protein
LNYASIEIFTEDEVIEFFFSQDVTESFPYFWRKDSDKEKLEYLLRGIPWTPGESTHRPLETYIDGVCTILNNLRIR